MMQFDVTLNIETPDGWNKRSGVAVYELENGGLYVLPMSKLNTLVEKRLELEKSMSKKLYPEQGFDESLAAFEIRVEVMEEMQISKSVNGEKYSPAIKWIITS